ncbi:hypothetical protein BGZ70_004368, partial [Mortierella alpina]
SQYHIHSKTKCHPPPTFSLQIDNTATLRLPLKNHLLLAHLATTLGVTIVIFSLRAATIVFEAGDFKPCIGFFHNVDSFFGFGEYLVLASSSHLTDKRYTPRLLPPRLIHLYITVTSLQHSSAKVSKRGKRKAADYSGVDQDECARYLKRSCHMHLTSKIKGVVQKAVSRSRFGSLTREEFYDQEKDKTMRQFKAMDSPKGVMKEAISSLKAALDLGDDVQYRNMCSKMGSASTVWRSTVEANFHAIWTRTVEGAEKKRLADADKGNKGKDKKDKEQAKEKGGDQKEEELRTCTVNMRSILRPDMQQHYDLICGIVKAGQIGVTNAIHELSFALRKAVHVMATTDLYAAHLGLPPTPQQPVDIRSILPARFVPRNGEAPLTVDVALIHPGLQEFLVEHVEGATENDDLALLQDSQFLSFMHTRLLGIMGGNAGTDDKYPTWTGIVDTIKDSTTECGVKAPAGLSHTMKAHVDQLATAHANLWTGSVFDKAMTYFLRVILRLHLAPERGARMQERLKTFKKIKREQVEVSRESQQSRVKTWRWRVSTLCDELERATRHGRSPRRVQAILKKLSALGEQEPQILPDGRGFLCIEDELALVKSKEANAEQGVLRMPEPVQASQEDTTMTQFSAAATSGPPQRSHDDLNDLDLEDEELLEVMMDNEDLDDLEEEEDLEQQGLATSRSENLQDIGTSPPSSAKGSDDRIQRKDSSAKRIRALQSVLKMLLESPKSGVVSPQDVQAAAFKGTEFDNHECTVVANLANQLRPYVPKRRPKPTDASPGGSATAPSLPH